MADENEHRIWILLGKIFMLKENITYCSIFRLHRTLLEIATL